MGYRENTRASAATIHPADRRSTSTIRSQNTTESTVAVRGAFHSHPYSWMSRPFAAKYRQQTSTRRMSATSYQGTPVRRSVI